MVLVMTVGEIDFEDTFIDTIGKNSTTTNNPLNPFPEASFVFISFFLLLMTIILMNLLVGNMLYVDMIVCSTHNLRWLNRVMQDHEARASDLNRKLIFSFFLLFS